MVEGLSRHFQTGLEFGLNHLHDPEVIQGLHLIDIRRPCRHFDTAAKLSGLGDDRAGHYRARHGDQQKAGVGNLRGFQDDLVTGIPENGGHFSKFDPFDAVMIQFDDDERKPRLLKNHGHMQTHLPAAGDHHMIFEAVVRKVDGLEGLPGKRFLMMVYMGPVNPETRGVNIMVTIAAVSTNAYTSEPMD